MFETTKEARELDGMFHGEAKPLHPDTIHMTFRKPAAAVSKTESTTAAHKVEKDKDAQYEPVKPVPNQMDKVKACAKSVLLFGGLSFLIFYWKEAGLMAESIAVPAIAVCTALAGFGAGKSAMGGGR
jgi:hypothetical protein